MSRADQRLRAAQGIPYSRNLTPPPAPMATRAPSARRCSCGRIHSPEDSAINQDLWERGIVECRERCDGEFQMRGHVEDAPRRFSIHDSVNAALACGGWVRVRFVLAPLPFRKRRQWQMTFDTTTPATGESIQ